ncbi:tyrosine-type recombinase/integrase [Bifidobacterium breve]|uniref:tyrosine-type recombinase/integrase n=1 Tax=Bifidobacterium breve TaxID=1685 RepID=UPI0018999064|nr:site-specific integrase [Bifidobacterium breve]
MAKTWISDQWLKPDAPKSTIRLLNASKDAAKAGPKIPDKYKKAKYGRGKRWAVQWYETVNGERKLRAKNFERKIDAETYATAVSDDKLSGRYVNVDNQNRLYKDVSEEWLQTKNSIKDSSHNGYEGYFRTYVLPKWGSRAIGSITSTEINEWIGELREGKAPHDFNVDRKPKPLGERSVRHIVNNTFGAVMRYAAKHRLIASNPLEGVELPKDNKPKEDPVFLTYKQVERLADSCKPNDALLVRMLAYTGLRPNEMLALHIGDLDMKKHRIRVVRNFTEDKKKRIVEGTPKTWEKRVVALPRFLEEALSHEIEGRKESDYVFLSTKGKAVNLANWRNRAWKSALKSAKLDKIEGLTPYSLRHTYASLAIAAGCDVKTLQNSMGHKDATETLNTYAAFWPDRLGEVADALESKRATALKLSHVVPEQDKQE